MTALFFILAIIVLIAVGGAVVGAIWTVLGYALTGLIVGALARLLVRNTQGLGLFRTILAGIVGGLGGGLIARALGQDGGVIEFLIALLVAAIVIAVAAAAMHDRTRR